MIAIHGHETLSGLHRMGHPLNVEFVQQLEVETPGSDVDVVCFTQRDEGKQAGAHIICFQTGISLWMLMDGCEW